MKKCDTCIFKDEYRDMSFTFDICSFGKDLGDAVKRCENNDKCTEYITRDDVIKIIKLGDNSK